ncbi:MAG TPA: AzlD domain-containing protein [Actinomycetota bacterium]|nr:AzlD domain-containing protein [Actinomycetota bacterium]
MSAAWVTVVLVGLATFAIKAAGPLLLAGRRLPDRLQGALDHLAPALLAALVATEALGSQGRLALDPRLLGLGAAAVALALRAPTLLVLVVAAGTTGLARALL